MQQRENLDRRDARQPARRRNWAAARVRRFLLAKGRQHLRARRQRCRAGARAATTALRPPRAREGSDRRPPPRSRQRDSVRAAPRGRVALRRTILVPVRARSCAVSSLARVSTTSRSESLPAWRRFSRARAAGRRPRPPARRAPAAAASRSRGTRSCTRSRRVTGAHTRSRATSLRHSPRRPRRAGRGASPTHRSPTPRRHKRASRWSRSRDPRHWWCARRAPRRPSARVARRPRPLICCAIVTRSAAWRRSRLLRDRLGDDRIEQRVVERLQPVVGDGAGARLRLPRRRDARCPSATPVRPRRCASAAS